MDQTGKALSRLSAATFLDQSYFKAHQRAGQIYYEKQMFAEAEREYAFASTLCPDQSLAGSVKDCQQQMRPFLRKDYYGILEIDKSIDPNSDEYQKKYKRICAKWHPDRYSRDPVMRRFAQIKFRLIQEADGVMRDKTKKMIYDQGGDPVNQTDGGMGGFNMGGMGGGVPIDISQIFNMMGGSFGGGMPRNVHFEVNGMPVNFSNGGSGHRGGHGSMHGMPPGFGDIFNMFGGF